MKFIENFGDIPDSLIDLVRKGKVTVICGAGVSMPVGFPSFKGLTEQVFERLGESVNVERIEKIAFSKEEYDRVLGFAEKSNTRF